MRVTEELFFALKELGLAQAVEILKKKYIKK